MILAPDAVGDVAVADGLRGEEARVDLAAVRSIGLVRGRVGVGVGVGVRVRVMDRN